MRKHRRQRRRNNKNNRNSQNIARLQLGRTVNLMKSGTSINLLYPTTLFYRQTSSQWSFSTGADLRYLAFAAVTANSTPFDQFKNVYSEYKVVGAALTIAPYTGIGTQTTNSLPMLYISCDPQGTASNPNNTTLIGNQSSHVFSAISTVIRNVRFTFPGIGTNMNIWLDTSVMPSGAFYVGGVSTTVSGNVIAFDCSFSLRIAFRGTKTN